jgi:hypothetical protein
MTSGPKAGVPLSDKKKGKGIDFTKKGSIAGKLGLGGSKEELAPH